MSEVRGLAGARRRAGVLAVWVLAAGVAPLVALGAAGGGVASADATRTVAFYDMAEPAGSTRLVDSSGNGLHGTIGDEVVTGQSQGGVTYHTFAALPPNQPPTHPGHLNRVPDAPLLDPGAGDYSVSIRYRTTRSYGNMIQKGQNGTAGGYFKFEQPNGVVFCLFKGGNGEQRTANSRRALNDGQWHVVTCVRTATYVAMYVDGVKVNQLNGPTGTIDNNKEITIAGKGVCDQIEVTCDYFPGDIDYVRILKGSAPTSNVLPNASFTNSCTALTCSFDGSGSSDPDGQIHGHSWNFGDGSTATGANASHTYTANGTYRVVLTVVDDDGGVDTFQRDVTVSGGTQASISFVGRASTNANALRHSLTLPAGVRAGDALVLLYSINTDARMSGPAGGVTGWTSRGSTLAGGAQTAVWTKVATAADVGKAVRVDLSKRSKGSLILVAYRGTNTTNPVQAVARAGVTGTSAARTTPTAAVTGTRSWVVSYWMHGDSATTALTPPAGVTARATGTQSGGGHVTTLVADTAAPVTSSSYGGLTVTAASASNRGGTWTIVLAPQG